MRVVGSFYEFRTIDDAEALAATVEAACRAEGLLGTVLVAAEGLNAALAGARSGVARVAASFCPEADVKWTSVPEGSPVFGRLKVRVKHEIVTFGLPLSPLTRLGRRVDAATWDALLDDAGVTVVDVRNDYESEVGTFRGAKLAGTASFGEFRAFVSRELDPERNPRLALFCTGGIRCEKASAYLFEQGFEDVCQLDGGILGYLADRQCTDAFEGECFVFDQRGTVKGGPGRED